MVVDIKNTNTTFLERTDTINQYLAEVRKTQVLTLEEEQKLLDIIKNSSNPNDVKRASQKLAEANQKFIVSVARHYAPTADKFLDCVSEGTIGLMEAIEAYDIKCENRFMTFAVYYIKRAITQYLRDVDPSIKKSNISKTHHLIAKARNQFIQEEEREPSPEELLDILNDKYNAKIKNIYDVLDLNISSIDDTISDDENDSAVGDLQMFNNFSFVSNDYETVERDDYNTQALTSMFNILSPREKTVITMAFGIGYPKEFDNKEIAQELNLSTERVRQMKNSIISRLQNEFTKRSAMI